MKSEKLLETIGKIDDNLIKEALEIPVKNVKRQMDYDGKTQYGWFKRLTIAACLCLVFSLPVLAIGQVLSVKFMAEQHQWEVTTQGRFPMEAFSKEALNRAEALGTEDGIYPMSGETEAEEFLGISLPENTILEEAHMIMTDLNLTNGERVYGNTITFLFNNNESKLVSVWVTSRYLYNGMDVEVSYKLVTELNPYENGGGMGVEINDDYQKQTMERYVTATGRECTIIYSDNGYYCRAYAYMDIEGIITAVELGGTGADNISECIKQIMDAYK